MIKRYLLFAFIKGQENGGMDDFINSFDSIDETMNYFNTIKLSKLQKVKYQVYDILENRYVRRTL